MKSSGYKTLGIGKDTHGRLKALARGAQMPITTWLDRVVGYFFQMGLHPDDLGSHGENKAVQQIKKQVDTLLRLVKAQEKKHLMPISETILEMNYQLQQVGTWVDVSCPKCQGDYREFAREGKFLICGRCEFRLRLLFGNMRLEELDIVTLLGGGMTREYENLVGDGGEVISCRFYLDSKDDYTLKMQR